MRLLRIGMSGSDVMEIQATLRKLGFDIAVDGVFGLGTQRAVREFQRAHKLMPDGIIGQLTFAAMEKYLLGYDKYIIKPGDTFYKIARRYGTQTALAEEANPDKDPNNLQSGQAVTVPFNFPVVDTNISYTHEALQRDIAGLKARYPFMETGILGYSALGRPLYYLRLGSGRSSVLYNAAIHSLEWITAPVLMKFAEDMLYAVSAGANIGGYDPDYIWSTSSIYIIPMVNPDGIDLVINGLSPDNPKFSDLIVWNNGSTDFSKDWQANNNGVDLNHNFNAEWELSRKAAIDLGITGPGPTRYPGLYPESEPESSVIADFTRSRDFRLVLAYHSQGEVIFWNFLGLEPPESLAIGERLAAASGYAIEEPTGITSYAGYKDWFIQDFNRPGYTIEVGLGKNPLPISQFDSIYARNLPLLLLAAVI